jgi:hypothetical protein
MVIKYLELTIRDIHTYLVNQQMHTGKIFFISVHFFYYTSINMHYCTDMEHIK